MAGKRRAVVIYHPDFDLSGKTGIEEAKTFAEHLIAGQKQMIEAARKSGEDPVKIAAVEKHTEAYTVVIRSIEKDMI